MAIHVTLQLRTVVARASLQMNVEFLKFRVNGDPFTLNHPFSSLTICSSQTKMLTPPDPPAFPPLASGPLHGLFLVLGMVFLLCSGWLTRMLPRL